MKLYKKMGQIVLILLLGILAVLSLMPFGLLVSSSISSEAGIAENGYSFFPNPVSLEAYQYLWIQLKNIIRAYGVTILVTVVGTVLGLACSSLFAYSISRTENEYRNILIGLVLFTMMFQGGAVSSYIIWSRMFKIRNTIWSLIFPNLMINGFNIILMRNYFSQSIPVEMLEAARIDGASEYGIFAKIVLPCSLPILATIGLMTGLGYWNDWINSLYYITKPSLYSLQAFLDQVISSTNFLTTAASQVGASTTTTVPLSSVRMALAVVGVLPIMVLYPFFQKYFVKGLTMGAVKG